MTNLIVSKLDDWLEATKPSSRENWPVYFVFGLFLASIFAPMILAVIEGQKRDSDIYQVIPWALLACIILITSRRVRRRKQSSKRIESLWEEAKLENWSAVEEKLEPILKSPIYDTGLRGRAFVMLANLAEVRKDHEAAAIIYTKMLQKRIGDPLTLHQAQLALASAKIRNEELTDAVELIGRLKQIEMPAPLRAIFEAVRLHQQVFMGQNEDAVADLEERRSLFRRHLSTRAGYAYGLLAAALHRLGRKAEAEKLWHDATMLVPPARLVDRFEFLKDVSAAYQPTSSPL